MNPTKFQICEYLIERHEKRGDKIIVFSDSVLALKEYALKLGNPFTYGPERMRILKQFQTTNQHHLSQQSGWHLHRSPRGICLIQISSHFGSSVGRVLRAKKINSQNFKVYFYSLVSKDTEEMAYSAVSHLRLQNCSTEPVHSLDNGLEIIFVDERMGCLKNLKSFGFDSTYQVGHMLHRTSSPDFIMLLVI